MSEATIGIRGIDPLLFRDARPFSGEVGASGARTLPFPLPSTIAGFLRTRVGNRRQWDWQNGGAQQARQVAVQGPLATCNGEVVFAAPRDALLIGQDQPQLLGLRPGTALESAVTDLPEGLVPLRVPTNEKPLAGYGLWPKTTVFQWLEDATATQTSLPPRLTGMPVEERIHVGMNAERGVGEEGRLFSAQYLSFERYVLSRRTSVADKAEGNQEWSLLARVGAEQDDLVGVGTFGGERRLAAVEAVPDDHWPSCRAGLENALKQSTRIRLLLATPALFSQGWRPGWLASGAPPAVPGVRLRLVAAAVGRREPLSGWDLEHRAPKALRWMVPAGSVFFFEAEGDTTSLAGAGWLSSVSDDEQDRRDGFGLALWGVW